MAKRLPQLTSPERRIMNVLWDGGRRSAREIHELVGADLRWAYTTTRTVLERMVAKDLLDKGPFHGIQLYVPRISRVTAVAAAAREFAEQVLDRDYAAMMSVFTRRRDFTAAELQELEQLLVPRPRGKAR